MNDDITDPDFYLNTFEEGIKRLYASTSEPTAHSSTTSPLTATRASLSFTAPLQPGKLPSVKTEPAKTPDYFTHSANEGSDPTVFLPQKGLPSGHTFSRQVSSIPAPPATPVTPNRPLSIPTGRQRTSPVDKARIADYPTDAVEYGDEGRSASSRPRETPDYAATATNEGFVPIVDGAAPGTAVSRSEKERVRQHRQVLQERLGNEGYVAPLKLNPSLSSRDSSEDVAKAKNRTAAAREQLGNEGYAAPLELNSKLISPDAPAELARTTAWTRTRQDQLGNEGYVAPLELNPALSSPVSAEEKARTREWVSNAREQLGHEGGTLPDNLAERVAEFHRNVQKNATVIDRFLRENDRIERSAYGIPARGEDSQSVFKMYLAAKTESDNAENPDCKQAIIDLSASWLGQADMDLYHSGAIGINDLGQKIVRFLTNAFMAAPPADSTFDSVWYDPETLIEYRRNPVKLLGYRFSKWFGENKQFHGDARSEDFKNTSLTRPAYLPVQFIGKRLEDWVSLAATLYLLSQTGPASSRIGMALAALNGQLKGYEEKMDELETVPEEKMLEHPVYCRLRQLGWSEEQARFAIADAEASLAANYQALYDLVKAWVTSSLTEMTRTGTESPLLKFVQDESLEFLLDREKDSMKNYLPGKSNETDKEE